MKCKKCGHEKCVKNGLVKGNQRYKCKSCNYAFQEHNKWAPLATKVLALLMYLEWLWFRSIWRILWYSDVAILYRIRDFWSIAVDMHLKRKVKSVEVLELDEMRHYVEKKRRNYEYGLLFEENDKELLILH